MTTGERVRNLCAEKGISVAKLERELGFGHCSISKANEIRGDRLQKIAEYFGESVEYLTTGERAESYYMNAQTVKVAQDYMENPKLRMLFDAARDASAEDLATTYEMLMALKKKERHEE